MAVVAAPSLDFSSSVRPATIPNNGTVALSSIHPLLLPFGGPPVIASPLPSVFYAGGGGSGGETSYPIAG